MLVMFLCIAIGFLLRKFRLAPENTASVLSKLELYVFLPAQILVTFFNYCTVETLQVQYRTVLYGALAVAMEIAIAIPAARFFFQRENRAQYISLQSDHCQYGLPGQRHRPSDHGTGGALQLPAVLPAL